MLAEEGVMKSKRYWYLFESGCVIEFERENYGKRYIKRKAKMLRENEGKIVAFGKRYV